MFRRAWLAPQAPWIWVAVSIFGALSVGRWVDLSPQVESDFFFSEDDPQLRASLELDRRFPAPEQIIIRAEDLANDEAAYRERLSALTDSFSAVEGVLRGYSITTDNPDRSPLFSRILLTPDEAATNIILQVEDVDAHDLLSRLEEVAADHRGPDLDVVMSGVPVIVERIRRSLLRDLVVFSSVAGLLFALLMTVVYRDAAVVLGTMVTAVTTVSITLLLTKGLGISIGLLTANIITIIFVLTLSHIVFLTGNWSQAVRDGAGDDAARQGVRATLEGSFWSMATTLFGFLSLLLASAKPLRELGLAGAIGTVTALVITYAAYPAFLARWAKGGAPERRRFRLPGAPAGRPAAATLAVVGTVVVLLGFGVPRLDTDPGLLTYFAPGSAIREGLERIDADGGSSILKLAVRDAEGRRIDTDEVNEAMGGLQAVLEADSAIGVVLSPPVLLGHARTQPLGRFLSLAILLDIAASPELDGVALSYVTEERDQGLFFMRMRETTAEPSRQAVMDRIGRYVSDAGLEPVLVGGLYDLQAQLGRLIASSLRIGLGGLLALFLGIAFVVSRSGRTTGGMFLCLLGIPLVVLGTFGHAGIAVDIITSPAANVALAMGVDSMIHLVVRVRRLHRAGAAPRPAWTEARLQIGPPVLAATLIICAGFGIFALSSFPPTRRFGLAVILGTLTAATMALLTLPTLASIWTDRDARRSHVGRAALFALFAAALTPPTDLTAQGPIVEIASGSVVGRVVDGVHVFRGIPYAAPPVGDLRWKPPQPVGSWTGVLPADGYGPQCMQRPYARGSVFGLPPRPTSEDCLYINVWSAHQESDPRQPVMVWVHGGAWTRGSGAALWYDGSVLALEGVVVVTINYRLGPFGFFAHPELSAESDHGASGNQGPLDMIAALEWVRDNIGAFGGDPGQVTIFGESAGSWGVHTLVASPLAKGLFHRAIGESGGRFGNDIPLRSDTGPSAEAAGTTFAETVGASSIVELRGMSADRIMEAWATPEGRRLPVVVAVDGRLLPSDVLTIFSEARQNDVPVLVGSNQDEATAFIPPMMRPTSVEALRQVLKGGRLEAEVPDEMLDAFLEAYGVVGAADVPAATLAAWRDAVFSIQMRTWAKLTEAAGQTAYLYYFTRTPPGRERLGAYHAAEIPYVFGNLGRNATAVDRRLSEAMVDYWVSFAKTGDPNGDGRPLWRPWDPAGQPFVELGDEVTPRSRLLETPLDLWEKVMMNNRTGSGR